MFDNLNASPELKELYRQMDEMPEPAACTNYPDAFYPEASVPGTSTESRWAVSMCNECPVKAQCALVGVMYESDGIWGGTTPMERRQLRANLRQAGHDLPDAV